MNYKYIYLLLILFFTSCAEKIPFTQVAQKQTFVTPAAQSYATPFCPDPFNIKPKVDILFLIDNSGSTNFMSNQMKESIAGLVGKISQDFNYHAYVAPLIAVPGENIQAYSVLASSTQDLPASVQVVSVNDIQFFQSVSGGSQELGFQRALSVIEANTANNIFRKQVNTVIITVSNGDDTDFLVDPNTGQAIGDNYPTRLQDLQKLTEKYYLSNPPAPSHALMSKQLRYISVVAHSACQAGFKPGNRYRNMSNAIYQYSGSTDQAGRSTPDSYDLCTNSFNNIFNIIAQSMPTTAVQKTYNFWLAKQTNNPTIDFDPNRVEVYKVVNNNISQVPANTTNGFSFSGNHYVNKNIRELPVVSTQYPAENYTGFMVELHGNAKLKTPGECMIVKIFDPQVWYGYIVLNRKPKPETVVVRIKGQVIPRITSNPVPSGSDGWSYMGYSESVNITVNGPGDDTPASPGQYMGGFVLKLHGSAIFNNEDLVDVQIDFIPDSI
jgi:hypothetical protein